MTGTYNFLSIIREELQKIALFTFDDGILIDIKTFHLKNEGGGVTPLFFNLEYRGRFSLSGTSDDRFSLCTFC